jgi:hypothetical protein
MNNKNMLYKQNTNYQNVMGVGRDCNDRWSFIEKYISYDEQSLSVDVGSAEGFFVKKLIEKTNGKVISIEGSDYVYKIQKEYISNDKVEIYHTVLGSDNIKLVGDKIDNLLLLSVLHWFEDPDYVLNYLGNISENIFVELPNLDCNKSYNQSYLKRIKKDFNSISNYLEVVSGKRVCDYVDVSANHVGGRRVIYYLS